MNNNLKVSNVQTDERGFTIVELLVAFAIFAVLALAITPVFKNGSDYWQKAQSQAELRQNLNSALDFMAGELRQSNGNLIIPGFDGAIVNYSVYGAPRHFDLENGAITFDNRGVIEPVTSRSTVDITDAKVSETDFKGVYGISITGRYVGKSAINQADRVMSVNTLVATRTGR